MLVDASVWIDHLRHGNDRLARVLDRAEALCHPFIVGELACGRLRNRDELISLLSAMPQVEVAEHLEVLAFVERHRLAGSGIGWIDVHLLASAALSRARLWTLDRRLEAAARRLGLAAVP